jgi:hypothetical protein
VVPLDNSIFLYDVVLENDDSPDERYGCKQSKHINPIFKVVVF